MEANPDNAVVVLQGRLADLKRAREDLAAEGIRADIVRPPHCNPNS
jgi:hypothetical protein